MARFELKKTTIMDADGTERAYTVIADRSTFERVLLHKPDDYVVCGSGFIRCKGRQLVAIYGVRTPVYRGSDNDTYYAPMSFFDGDWRHHGPSTRGVFSAVTKDSGTGKLFADLEAFSEANNVPYCG